MRPAGRGRPLRFVGAIGLGWIGMRLACLWPVGSPGLPHPLLAALPGPPARASPDAVRDRSRRIAAAPPAGPHRASAVARAAATSAMRPLAASGAGVVGLAVARPVPSSLPPDSVRARTPGPSPPPAPLTAAPHARWTGSAWLALRPGQGIGTAPAAGQLGGSQYGIRLAYALDSRGRVAAFGRLAGPLRGRGAEAALGLEWRPGRAPLRIALEQRVGLDGVRGGPGIGIVGGVGHALARFRLEAYGQAGMIVRHRAEPYADGALRLTRLVTRGRAGLLEIGIGTWGAAQRDVQRLDIGPTLVARLPIGALQARIAFDWRQRIAGQARPGSGPALTLGSDF